MTNSASIKRLRARNDRYREGIVAFDAVQGDGDGGYLSMIGPLVSELAQTGTSIAQKAQEKSDAQKKAAEEQAKYNASEEHAAEVQAKNLRKIADDLARKAKTLRAKAGVTKSPADIKAADEAEKLAALSEIDAKAAEEKYASFKGAPSGGASGDVRGKGGGFVLPTWGKILIGALSVATGGVIIYKVAKK